MTATGLQRADGKSDWNSDEEDGDRKGDKDGYRYRRGKNINIDSINREIDLRQRIRNHTPLISVFNLMKLVR
jgi:hypothetical protein